MGLSAGTVELVFMGDHALETTLRATFVQGSLSERVSSQQFLKQQKVPTTCWEYHFPFLGWCQGLNFGRYSQWFWFLWCLWWVFVGTFCGVSSLD